MFSILLLENEGCTTWLGTSTGRHRAGQLGLVSSRITIFPQTTKKGQVRWQGLVDTLRSIISRQHVHIAVGHCVSGWVYARCTMCVLDIENRRHPAQPVTRVCMCFGQSISWWLLGCVLTLFQFLYLFLTPYGTGVPVFGCWPKLKTQPEKSEFPQLFLKHVAYWYVRTFTPLARLSDYEYDIAHSLFVESINPFRTAMPFLGANHSNSKCFPHNGTAVLKGLIGSRRVPR